MPIAVGDLDPIERPPVSENQRMKDIGEADL